MRKRPSFTMTGHAARFLFEGKRIPAVLGILCTLLILWLQITPPPGIESLITRVENLIYDQRYNLMPKPVKGDDSKIVIVDLDERSQQVEGRWPWDRAKMAELVKRLEAEGVLVAGFDITFPEPQRNVVRDLLDRADPEVVAGLSTDLLAMEDELDSDQAFADALASPMMDTVLAMSFNPIEESEYGTLPAALAEVSKEVADELLLPEMAGYTGNIAVLQNSANGAGIMNQLPDVDGIIRRVPLVVSYEDSLYPTLALEMARVYFFEEQFELMTREVAGQHEVAGVRVGSRAGQYEIATDARAQVLVPFVGNSVLSGGDHYPYVSATDVLNNNVPPGLLENSLVLVGTTATGLFDLRSTPLEAVYPGVEVHANMLNAILKSFVIAEYDGSQQPATGSLTAGPEQTAAFPYKPDWEAAVLFFSLAIGGVILSLLLPRLGPASLAITGVGLVVVAVWGNFVLWSELKMDLSLSLVLLLLILLTVINMAYGFLSESLSRRTIKGMFDQYVPPAHIDAMLKDPGAYNFEGESRELTVLFSDIRNFTSISESLTATELKTLLNDFFTPVTGIIFAHNGTIDKYVGDMVMAFWGAPVADSRHRANAVAAALEILQRVDDLKQEFHRRGLPEVSIGVGINTGVMNVGDMGSVYRRSYTVLGDAVNLGSRLEGLTKFYGISLLVGEETHSELDEYLCRLVDKVKVKGKDQAVRAYEPLGLKTAVTPELRLTVERYHQAQAYYFSQQWRQAEQGFTELLIDEPDTLLYKIYLQRIEILRQETLPQDWDGAFHHTSK